MGKCFLEHTFFPAKPITEATFSTKKRVNLFFLFWWWDEKIAKQYWKNQVQPLLWDNVSHSCVDNSSGKGNVNHIILNVLYFVSIPESKKGWFKWKTRPICSCQSIEWRDKRNKDKDNEEQPKSCMEWDLQVQCRLIKFRFYPG